jgi:hypothetical protein
MTTENHSHQDECLMCAVRALTEGNPPVWQFTDKGDNVSGVVLKMGNVSTDFGQVPYVDLWLGGHRRSRIMAYASMLRHAIEGQAPQIGDTVTVKFEGTKEFQPGTTTHGRTYKLFTVTVERGHH